MNEFENNVMEEVEEAAAVDTAVETERPDFGGYAILGLAGVGAGFLLKKAYDGGKVLVGKIKAKVADRKAAKAAASEPKPETKPTTDDPQESSEE